MKASAWWMLPGLLSPAEQMLSDVGFAKQDLHLRSSLMIRAGLSNASFVLQDTAKPTPTPPNVSRVQRAHQQARLGAHNVHPVMKVFTNQTQRKPHVSHVVVPGQRSYWVQDL